MWARYTRKTQWAKQRRRIWDHLSFCFVSFICPSPQPFSLPASPISSDNNTGKGVEEEVEEGSVRKDVGPLLLTRTSRVCARRTRRVLPLRHFAVASTRCPCMAACRGALLAFLLTLSFLLPLCQSSSFHPLGDGEVHVRALHFFMWHSWRAQGCVSALLVHEPAPTLTYFEPVASIIQPEPRVS